MLPRAVGFTIVWPEGVIFGSIMTYHVQCLLLVRQPLFDRAALPLTQISWVLPPLSVGKMTLRLYGALNYRHGFPKGPSFGTGRDGLSARGFRNPQLLAEQPRAPTQRRVVRDLDTEPEKRGDRVQVAFGLSVGELVHHPDNQARFNRHVRMDPLTARLTGLVGLPVRDCLLVKPDCQIAPAAQPFVGYCQIELVTDRMVQ